MSMNEKDLKRLIEEQTEQMRVPESLEPEHIEKMLEEKGKKKQVRYYQKIGALAACGLLVIGLYAGTAGLTKTENTDGQYIAENADTDSTESARAGGSDASDGTNKDQADAGEGKSGGISGRTFEVTEIRSAEDYDEIYEYIEEAGRREQMKNEIAYNDAGIAAEGISESADFDSAAQYDAAAPMEGAALSGGMSDDYSETNVREEGVGEADIVKTDGKRLYIMNNRRIQIVDIEKKKMELLGSIKLDQENYAAEIFVKDDRLVVIYTHSEYEEQENYGGYYRELTVAETYDVSNPKKPKLVGKISQSGNYNTMRAVGDYIYLFSDFYADSYGGAREQYFRYIPEVQGERIAAGDILMPWNSRGNRYTVISSFSIRNPEGKLDSKAVFGSTGICYVSGKNIYICEAKYDSSDNGTSQTCIRKISYQDGNFEAVGQTIVDGTLNDSFSIDEYKGNLRLVVTVRYDDLINQPSPLRLPGKENVTEEVERTDSNSLYILDENLEELSRIEGLAPDETIYSARFMGDAGYFVTFRQVDPLFSADLSDPEKPEIIGSLKIPGFSEYLHPYGEGMLLGIGMDVDETGMTTEGVKLSMFDISDPADVKEIQKYTLENTYSTDVSYNYKAAFVDVEKNLIGFNAYGDDMKYYIFSYEEDQFVCRLERELGGYSSDVRGLYSGSRLYLVSGNTVEAYEIDTMKKTDDIVL